MWYYAQATGELKWDDILMATGYSGHGDGKNNPALEDVPNTGPIPQGTYLIGDPFDTETHGPFCLRLIPTGATNTFGRHGFLMHGDGIHDPGQASEGCIIMAPQARHAVVQSGDKDLTVTA